MYHQIAIYPRRLFSCRRYATLQVARHVADCRRVAPTIAGIGPARRH
jgi:hypothetical protein